MINISERKLRERKTILQRTEQKPQSQKVRQNETVEKCLAPEEQQHELSQSEKDNMKWQPTP
ncbi:unnamed protein product, partial [Rangifer tarandus platyrhynchus]